MKKFLILLVILAILGGGAYYFFFAPKDTSIEVVQPQRGPAVQAVYATGTVEPTVMMPIAPRSTARLMKLSADEGQDVVKGEILGQLEDSDVQNELDEVAARADFARKDYARKAELLKRGAISKGTADQSKSDLDAANAAVARVKSQLSYMQLIAPESGTVMRRDGEVGELIPANQPVFWMSCCAPLRISAEVDEEDIVLVKNGLPVLVRADAFPGKVFHGKVNSITPKGDAISRSYRVRVGLDDAETPLLTGMTAETNIIISETKDAMLVPASAVKEESVWIIVDGKLAKRKVVSGARSNASIEIRSGLSMDDTIVKTYRSEYEDGDDAKVKAVSWKTL